MCLSIAHFSGISDKSLDLEEAVLSPIIIGGYVGSVILVEEEMDGSVLIHKE